MNAAEIRDLRKSLGLSQPEFARVYRITVRALRDWEQDVVPPSTAAAALLRAIAAAPDVMRELLA